MPIGMLDYHLKYLEKNGLIVSKPNTYYTRYYPYERELGEDEKNILSFLRQEIPRGIIIYLLQNPRAKHREILSSFNVSGATLSYHLKRMAEKGIAKQLRLGRESEFSLKDDNKISKELPRQNSRHIHQKLARETMMTERIRSRRVPLPD
jgi:predicted transcriptional regulator